MKQFVTQQAANPGGQTPARETGRDYYAFALVLTAIIASCLYAIAIVGLLRGEIGNQTVTVVDIVALITGVTGVIGTLVGTFFGVRAGQQTAELAISKAGGGAAEPATVGGIDPSHGPHTGNTKVSIRGNGLSGAAGVNFGNTPATSFEVKNDGLIYATSPAATGKDSVELSVIFPSSDQKNVTAGTFYYYTVNADKPNEITIEGDASTFRDLRAVEVGGTTLTGNDVDPEGRLLLLRHISHDGASGKAVPITLVYAVDTPTNRYTVGEVKVTEPQPVTHG